VAAECGGAIHGYLLMSSMTASSRPCPCGDERQLRRRETKSTLTPLISPTYFRAMCRKETWRVFGRSGGRHQGGGHHGELIQRVLMFPANRAQNQLSGVNKLGHPLQTKDEANDWRAFAAELLRVRR
jgi:hypothetical protein